LKLKYEHGLEFISSGLAEATKVTDGLEVKCRWTNYGLIFAEKWNTDNKLGTAIMRGSLHNELKLTCF
jgi:hypothetical protein